MQKHKSVGLVCSLLFVAAATVAAPGSPEWIVGVWQAENGQTWEFEAINDGSEGIIEIREHGEVVHYWGWRYRVEGVYHVKRYYDYYESFVVHVRGNNAFLIQAMRDAREHWILHRLGKQLPEWDEGL